MAAPRPRARRTRPGAAPLARGGAAAAAALGAAAAVPGGARKVGRAGGGADRRRGEEGVRKVRGGRRRVEEASWRLFNYVVQTCSSIVFIHVYVCGSAICFMRSSAICVQVIQWLGVFYKHDVFSCARST